MALSTSAGSFRWLFVAALVAVFAISLRARSQVFISEFVASNSGSHTDEDGDASDWIEIYNPRNEPINVEGFALTDDRDNLTKWTFPSVTIPGNGYVVVFASGKDRKPAEGGQLHTNFQLNRTGEYLALVKPDGETLETVFTPAYPEQRADIAYGIGKEIVRSSPISEGAECKWLVPASADEIDGWTTIDFDDSGWQNATTGIGYGYDGLVSQDGNVRDAMVAVNASIFLRIRFDVPDAAGVNAVTLRMKFEDGFVAYLNGREISRFNAPDPADWNSAAIQSHPDSQAEIFQDFTVDFAGALMDGTNVLAIHGMNATIGGSDFLALPKLKVISSTGETTVGFLAIPTPGAGNESPLPRLLKPPVFSVSRGHYSEPVELELTTPQPDVEIFYTDDGSAPGSGDHRYSEPIPISETTVIRAVTIRGDEPPSEPAAHSYLFLKDIVEQQELHTPATKRISESEIYGPLLEQSLLALPTVCVSLDRNKPTTSEVPMSVEFIDPAGQEPGFQINAGIMLIGGASVSSPKNNWRVMFRSEYGASKLRYPLFAGHPYSTGATDEFSRLMFRSGSHDSFFWLAERTNPSSGGRRSDATYLRNRWINDMAFVMGHGALHGRFVQMFVNGQYHGQYHVMEWPNDDFHASYFGGSAEDHHFTNGANRTKAGSDHGNGDTWFANWEEIKRRARGDDFAAAAELIDMENLIDYMLLSFYSGNTWDWNSNQNWMAGGPKTPGMGGWKFYHWDTDIIFQDTNGNNLAQNVPDNLFADLVRTHLDFRILVRDRIHKHFFNDGALTPARIGQVFDFRANEIFDSLVAETARWQPGNPTRRPWDRDGEWQEERNFLTEIYFPRRTEFVLNQLRKSRVAGKILYPIEAAEFSSAGGVIEAGFQPTLVSDSGSIYFTTDGSDPRLPSGEVAPTADVYSGGVHPATFIVKGSIWKYLDDGSDQGTAWRETEFDDSSWAQGAGQFGYGDGDESTDISFGDDPESKHITTYFRKSINFPRASIVTRLKIGLLRDDGAAVYVNGTEVVRDQLTSLGPVEFDTTALTGAGNSTESTYFVFDIPSSLLVDGKNAIAVEIHQNSATSSDMSFDLELTGRAHSVSADLIVTEDTIVRARVFDGEAWSAITEAFYTIGNTLPPSASNVIASEIHYHPSGDDNLEFIELRNTSDLRVDLSGASFIVGVGFTFPDGTVLEGEQSLVVVGDLAAFKRVYVNAESPLSHWTIQIAGEFTGSLRNSGERIVLADQNGKAVLDFAYNDTGDWPGRADGAGSSLELKAFTPEAIEQNGEFTPEVRNAWLNQPGTWRPSSEFQGSPGRDGSGPDNRIVVNEVLANPIDPAIDAIELLNTTAEPISLAGWFLSDDNNDYQKYAFPDDTTLAPGEFLVVNSDAFGEHFGLSGLHGDDVYLTKGDASGNLLCFVDHVEFPASAPGESYGRWPDAQGSLYPMLQNTLGHSNANDGNNVRIGPVIISQIHYNPDGPDDLREFLILENTSATNVNLGSWRLRGEVDIDFTEGTTIAAGGRIVLVGFDPGVAADLSAFRVAYPLSPEDGGYMGPWHDGAKLNDGGGSVRLMRAGALVDEPGAPFQPTFVEDAVRWNDSPRWPQNADGGGASLHRRQPLEPGDQAGSWIAGEPFGSAGDQTELPGYRDWAAATFDPAVPPDSRLPGADPDGDGVPNHSEYAFAGNPNKVDPQAASLQVEASGNGWIHLSAQQRATENLRYSLITSTDLVAWAPVPAESIEAIITSPLEAMNAHKTVYRIRTREAGSTGYFRLAAKGAP